MQKYEEQKCFVVKKKKKLTDVNDVEQQREV